METSVPVAAGVRCRERRVLATLRVGENEHGIAEPGTDVSVRRLPDLCARMETVIGDVVVAAPVAGVVGVAPAAGVIDMSPVCSATAV